jgi:hypothetical protein
VTTLLSHSLYKEGDGGTIKKLSKKISKKPLTSFWGGAIELKKFNLLVLLIHKIRGKGGETGACLLLSAVYGAGMKQGIAVAEKATETRRLD